MEKKDTNIMKLSGCLSLSDFVRSRPFRNPCTSAARVCMETEEKNTVFEIIDNSNVVLFHSF